MGSTFVLMAVVAQYGWGADGGARLDERFAPPRGFVRVEVSRGGFGAFLRGLPLLPPGTPVRLYTGRLKARQDVHAAVIDLDVGGRDLQQCADAVMRLRAEWLFGAGRAAEVSFNDTGRGAPMPFSRWAKGERPFAKGSALVWRAARPADGSRASFRQYLDAVFTWAGTHSLERQLSRRAAADVAPGDVVIAGGFPGHAVLVLDVAKDASGTARVLLGQSYMPAQSVHVLRQADGDPWFPAPAHGEAYVTPEWTFPPGSLKGWERGG
ncbi:MAG: DUF4846 domain-containing protein [Myxococcaceae bacterium]|nr:DUF4846 domain-containing protein [Myxococcaceae bacterium]